MDDNTNNEGVQVYCLFATLEQSWFKMPHQIMQDIGPATQTLAGILKLTNKETFTSAENIASPARLRLSTVRKHLVILHNHGWLENKGREHTRRGQPRRTATIKITSKTKDHLEPYGILPWWACCSLSKKNLRLPWSSKALLSVIMSRAVGMKVVQERIQESVDDCYVEPDDDDGERFRFSLRRLEQDTGLTRESIVDAKQFLARHRIILWGGSAKIDGITKDMLRPNWGLEIIETRKGGPDDSSGQVEFIARFREKDLLREHHEEAHFTKENGTWYFTDGVNVRPKPITVTKIGRNDPCSCGSGVKYKKCCGANVQ
jgi:hypothetical protein